jgi:hypothetical protein
MERKKLSDILAQANGGGNWIDGNWGDTAPAPEFGPIPQGAYEGHLIDKFPFTAGTGTPGIKLTFSVLTEGQFKGRKLWYDVWLTSAAKPQALRDFAKLGIHDKSQIDMPLPTDKRIRCRLVVGIHQSNTGEQYNVVKRFEPLGVDAIEADPFAPAPTEGGPQS